MRIHLIIIFLLYSIFSFGQQLSFKGAFVDTISIEAHSSVYQFDEVGTTKGKTNRLVIVFNTTEGHYEINSYEKGIFESTVRPDTIFIKSKDVSKRSDFKFNSIDLNSLLNSLTTDHDSKSLFNQIDTTKFNKYITEKSIRRVAKRYKIDWYFKKRYSTKTENELFFKLCRSTDSLKTYLNDRFTKGYVIITDVSSVINIIISTNKSNFRYEGKYPNPVKQPWYYIPEMIELNIEPIMNLDINKHLKKILPHDFLLIETISDHALFDDYITWYLERREVKI
jgi:hypothetical protein